MIRYKKVPSLVAVSATCDRCGRKMPQDSGEFHERTSISYQAGYESVFGDGNLVECDLCQNCVKELLGPWLRICAADGVPRLPILERKSPVPGALDVPLSKERAEALEALVVALRKNPEDASRAIGEAVASVEESTRRSSEKRKTKKTE